MTAGEEPSIFMREDEAAALIGCCAKTIKRLSQSDPTFPPRVRIGLGSAGPVSYSRARLVAWAAARAGEAAPAGEAVARG